MERGHRTPLVFSCAVGGFRICVHLRKSAAIKAFLRSLRSLRGEKIFHEQIHPKNVLLIEEPKRGSPCSRFSRPLAPAPPPRTFFAHTPLHPFPHSILLLFSNIW